MLKRCFLLAFITLLLISPSSTYASGSGGGSGGGSGSGSSGSSQPSDTSGNTSGGGQSGGSMQITPEVLSCMKKLLTPNEFKKAQKNVMTLTGNSKQVASACFSSGGSLPKKVSKIGEWITVNPVDLSHVTEMSQFRSCAGHDFSGLNIKDQTEKDRSMKHYIVTDIPWTNAGAISGYAPFAGTVTIAKEESGIGDQMKIYNSKIGWSFILFHVKSLVANNTKVTAGQKIATWPGDHTAKLIQNATPTVSFDFALVSAYDVKESPLVHMTPTVANQYAAKGFTASTLILEKATRDAKPCNGIWSDIPGGSGYVKAKN